MTDGTELTGWVAEVLGFWFERLDRADWFRKSAATDELIQNRFLPTHAAVSGMPEMALRADARTALASVIVLDQFPRNMFRDTPAAFASDAKALVIARGAVSRGLDRDMEMVERLFLYLPFEHSEDMADQDRAVALIGALGDAEFTRYAEAHRDVVRRFGRFPHRNVILGRESTPEERAYLAEPGSGF